ncbi:MAG: TonB-dependent receptor [Sphingobacteriales bacterium JAD_PAG50586_3]|nr:MAG: TonB-dependent receptor [Sphingobacteriales bacterium JAD_PAG50586_3]
MAWLALCSWLCQPLWAQQPLAGSRVTVLAPADSKPITTATIVFTDVTSGKQQSVPTDVKGEALNPFDKKTAVFIYAIGYEKIQDTLSTKGNKTFFLRPLNVNLNDVIVTGQYGSNTADQSVYKVRVIGEDRIKAQGAVNLRDVLTNDLNIRLSNDPVLGSSMTMMGIGGENIKILIDGVPMVGRTNGNIDLTQINLNNIERIEVVEGPLSVSYGTNALGGAINLITKKNQKNEAELRVSTYYESVGQYNVDGRLGLNKNRHSLQLTGGRNFFDGFAVVDTSRFKDWKPKEQYFGNLNYGYRFKALTLNYSGEYFRELITNRGQRRQPYYETAFDDYYRTQRINNSVTLSGKVAKYNLSVIAAYNYFGRRKNTYLKDLTTLTQEITPNPTDHDTTAFGLIMSRGSISTSKQREGNQKTICNYEAGYDFNYENMLGKRIKDNVKSIGDYAVFTSAEFSPVKQLTFRPGIRYAYNTVYKAPLVPSFNVLYSSSKGITVRASYARGFRAPSLKELYFNFVDVNHNIVGNEALKAENSNNYSLNFTYRTAPKNTVIKTDVSAFYNRIQNLITLAQLQGTSYTYANIGNYRAIGVQGGVDYWVGKFRIGVGASYIGRSGVDVSTMSYSPEARSNISFNSEKAGLVVSLFYKYTGRLQTFYQSSDGEILQNSISAFNTLDITASKNLWKRRINLSAGCKNLLNVQNVQANVQGGVHGAGSNSAPMAWGRTVFVKLDINFIK